MQKRLVAALFVLSLLLCASCVRVKAHQRETLAHPSMQRAPSPGVERADQHVFEVREGSSGATGNPGGGCGCN